MNKIKDFWNIYGSLIIFGVFFILGIYVGGWRVFLKPVIRIVSTTTISWGTMWTCILHLILGDVVWSLFWLVGGAIMAAIDG